MSPATGRDKRRRGFQWPVVLWLTLVWVLLWGNFSVANVASGLVLSSLVLLVFPLPPIVFTGRIRPLALARLVGRFAADLVAASAQVAWEALRIGPRKPNAVIEVDLRSHSDLYLTITAELLSLVPGSLVVEARRSTSTLFLHVLAVEGPEDVERARHNALRQEERVVRALASPDELTEFRAAVEADR